MSLGQVQYDQNNSRIKVGHPLYDISLIDERSREWDEYLSKRLSKDAANPYKNELKP
jgi:hypothetical protein